MEFNSDLIFKLNRLITLYNYNIDKQDFFRKKTFVGLVQKIKDFNKPLDENNKYEILNQKGVGPKSKDVINEYLKTGNITKLNKLEEKVKPFVKEKDVIILFKTIHGIGNAKAKELYDQGYRTFSDLENHLDELTHAQQLGLKYRDDFNIRISRKEIDCIDSALRIIFDSIFENIIFEISGSYKRGNLTSGDIDVIVKNNGKLTLKLIIDTISKFKNADYKPFLVGKLTEKGEAKFMGIVRISDKLPARRLDIFLSNPEEWGAHVLFATGNGNFNVRMRSFAETKGFKINEKFVEDVKTKKKYYFEDEREIFDLIGMPYVEPNERK